MARQSGGYQLPKPKDTTFTPDWYAKNMPSDVADQQSQALGITTDQLHQMYSAFAQANPGVRATWEPTYTNQGVGAGGTVQSAPPALPWIQQQIATQKAQQVLNPQTPQQAQPQFQMPQLGPAQPTPTVPITPLTAAPQFGATQAGAPTMNVPQASAQGATPLFSLGAGQNQSWMLPQAQTQPVQPQQLRTGGPVRGYQGGGQVTPDQQQPQPWEGGIQGQGYNLGPSSFTPSTGSTPTSGAYGWYNPLYAGSALGAWALGMPMVVNPTPSGQPSSRSGVAAVGQPQVYQPGFPITLPSGQHYTAEQTAAFTPQDWAEIQQSGYQRPAMPPGYETGPWAATDVTGRKLGNVFQQAPMPTVRTTAPGWTGNLQMPLTAQTPANAAQMPQMPITPAANAAAAVPQQVVQAPPPAAPGAAPPQMQGGTPTSFMAAHTSALADAGRALFAHFGGDPNAAGPGDIANFHTQLTGMIGQLSRGGAAAPASPPKKMASGGLVTPVQGFADGGLSGPMGAPPGYFLNPATGSYEPLQTEGTILAPITVQGTPPQRSRQISAQAQGQPQPQAQPQQQYGQPQPQYYQSFGAQSGYPGTGSNQTQQLANLMAARTMGQNAALSARLPAYPTATTPAAQGYAAAANAGQITGGAPTAAELSKAASMTPGQIQGSIAKANMPAAGAASAIGSLGSGLAAAAQTYANSIKPWQMQASAIPNPDDFRRNQQQITLQEPRVV